MCCESYLPDKALRKHLLIANLIQEYSYHVEEPPVMSKRRSWWFDRRVQAKAEVLTKVLAQTSDFRRHMHAVQVTARADVADALERDERRVRLNSEKPTVDILGFERPPSPVLDRRSSPCFFRTTTAALPRRRVSRARLKGNSLG